MIEPLRQYYEQSNNKKELLERIFKINPDVAFELIRKDIHV